MQHTGVSVDRESKVVIETNFRADKAAGFALIRGLAVPSKFKALVSLQQEAGMVAGEFDYEISGENAVCTSFALKSLNREFSIDEVTIGAFQIAEIGTQGIRALAGMQELGSANQAPVLPSRRVARFKQRNEVEHEISRELLRVAVHYTNPVNSASPTKAVQLLMGYGSRHTALRRISEARSAGLILPRGAAAHEVAEVHEILRNRLRASDV